MFEKLPFSGQLLIFVALALGLVAAAYFIYPDLGDMNRRIEDRKDEFERKQAEIQKGRAAEQRLPELEREIASYTMQLAEMQQILPTAKETGDLLRWIKNLGDQSNLDLKSFAPGTLRPAEFYKEFPIDMQVVGRYHDLGIFLDRVSNYSRIINVDNLRIGASREPGASIQASLTATTFVYVEEGEEELQ